MIKVKFTPEIRDQLLVWLHTNVDANSRPDYKPNHSSWLNKTTTWRSQRTLWLLTQNDYKQILEIECFDPIHETRIKDLFFDS